MKTRASDHMYDQSFSASASGLRRDLQDRL